YRRGRPLDRRLFSGKKENLVLYDGAAKSTAELVPLEAVFAGCVKILRIQCAVPQEFKNIPMKCIRSRFRHGVDCAGGVVTILRGQSIHFDFELLERVGERQ